MKGSAKLTCLGLKIADLSHSMGTSYGDSDQKTPSGGPISRDNVHKGLEAVYDSLQSLFEGTHCGFKVIDPFVRFCVSR